MIDTLASLAQQKLPDGVMMRIVVADNDAEASAEAIVKQAAADLAVDLTYVHAPSRNICIARNACLDAAFGQWIAFLDDDETATPGWLAALIAEAQETSQDAILGPVQAVYSDQAPSWISAADLHSTRPVVTANTIRKGYAGNVLISRKAIERQGLRFDLALGRIGGEDDDFFYRFTDGGGTIGFAPGAVAFEPVPRERSTLSWLLQRSFRTGQTHGARLASRHAGIGRALQIVIAIGKGVVCLAGACSRLTAAPGRNSWLVRGALHLGVAAKLSGLRDLQQY